MSFSLRILLMKAAIYFYTFTVLMIPLLGADHQQLMCLRNHDCKLKNRAKTLRSKATRIRNTICNEQTCTKCLNLFATASNISQVPRKMKLGCAIILKLRSCCTKNSAGDYAFSTPHKLTQTTKFDKGNMDIKSAGKYRHITCQKVQNISD